MLEKERGYQDKEEESGNEVNEENSSDSSEEEETNSENSQAEESHNSGLESDWEGESENSRDFDNSTIAQAKVHDPCQHCNGSHGYDSVVMKCLKCFWEDNCKVCPICNHRIPLQ